MNNFRKRILPILLGAMVTIPSISAFAETKDGDNTIVTPSKIMESAKGIGNRVLGDKFKANLTEEQKAALETIISELRAGNITREEAAEKLKALNLDFGKTFQRVDENSVVKGNLKDFFAGGKFEGANRIFSGKNDIIEGSSDTILNNSKEIKDLVSSFKSGDIDRTELTEKLKELGAKIPSMLGKTIKNPLTEEQRAEVKDLRSKVKDGTITKEEAAERFEELGINFQFGKSIRPSVDLTEEQKEAIKTIKEELRAGTITREEATQKIKDLGLKFEKVSRDTKKNSNLTEDQKASISKLRDQVRAGEITKEEYYSAVKSIIAE